MGRPNQVWAEKYKKLAEIQGDECVPDWAKASTIQGDLKLLMEQEDAKWKQREKINWLNLGDKNTKFFHLCANQRRRTNKISSIHDEGGGLCETQ